MDPNQEIENIGEIADDVATQESATVDDFIKQLEMKEKDLHITADMTIEIRESFDDGNPADFIEEVSPSQSVSPPSATAAAPSKTKAAEVSTGALEKEIDGLKEQISQLEANRREIIETSQRRARDFENLKSRTERERNETFRNQIGNLATQMLPALDNLNRAVDFALAMPAEQRDEIKQFFDGIVLVNQQVNDVFAEMGIQPIATVGEMFDPHFHEAVATEETSELEPNTVSAELLRGYRIGDRVIRHSMVKVTKALHPADPDTTSDNVQQEMAAESSDSQDCPDEE